MPDKLRKPWLVAVWPGMGQVAIGAGYFLMAKLGMGLLAELPARELFDADHVDVEQGLIRLGRMPRSRLFVWRDPAGRHDLVLFIGEAQPPAGKYDFCRRLVGHALELGVERVLTFAAMATPMHPKDPARVFGAAVDPESLAELRQLEVEVIEDGRITGLNGLLLGVAAEQGLRGACLLGQMPHLFPQLPFPRASMAVLEIFTTMAGIELDLGELAAQAEEIEGKLDQFLSQVEHALETQVAEEAQEEPPAEPRLGEQDWQRIERLFAEAQADRARAFDLKRELDRLEVFGEYEDRFLDLFSHPG